MEAFVTETNSAAQIKTATVPFSCFADIKRDIAEFAQRKDLNKFQKWIAAERYVLEPKLDFEPQSIIAVALRFQIYRASLHYKGRRYVSEIDHVVPTEAVQAYLSEGNGYSFFFDYWLPQKRIAVRSGLAEYGKNNLCFVEGMGSLVTLFCFLSDMPCPEDYTWREVQTMSACEVCSRCRENCPTGAILQDRFLLDNERCLSAINEGGGKRFPKFVPKSAHHRTVHCSRCQDVCPKNEGRFDIVAKTIEFDQGETKWLLSGKKLEKLPAGLLAKIEECDMKWYYNSLPRNLHAWFESGA